MPAGVLFGIDAPLVSWSESGTALRPTDQVPTWSAIVGLIGAALGLSRTDNRLAQIALDYGMAVEIRSRGLLIEDFHTIHSPKRSQSEKIRASTRSHELSVETVYTTITRREYVSGASYLFLVISLSDTPVFSTSDIANALGNPVFPLYAGRRSCPLGRINATIANGEMDEVLPKATHWDSRIATSRSPSLIRERRDLRSVNSTYLMRRECVA
jgi:CRISPR system Cascade subunit CasD